MRCSARVGLPAEHAVLLIPAVGGVEEAGEFIRDERQHEGNGVPEAAYRYRATADTTHWHDFSSSAASGMEFWSMDE